MGATYEAVMDHSWSVEEILALPDRMAGTDLRADLSRFVIPDEATIWSIKGLAKRGTPLRDANLWTIKGPGPSIVVARQALSIHTFCKVRPFLLKREFRDTARRMVRQTANVLALNEALYISDFNSGVEIDLLQEGHKSVGIQQWVRERGTEMSSWETEFHESDIEQKTFMPPYFIDRLES